MIALFSKLSYLLSIFEFHENKHITWTGDFILFFDTALEVKRGSPFLNTSSLSKPVSIKETVDLCKIFRILNTKKAKKTFSENVSYLFIAHIIASYLAFFFLYIFLSCDFLYVTLALPFLFLTGTFYICFSES